MNKRQFIRNRRPAWHRFESLVRRLERSRSGLKPGEIAEFSRLLREVSNDLATIRSREWGDALASYLNGLFGRGHNAFYTSPPGQAAQALQFVVFGFPALLRANVGYFLVASLLFFVPFVASWAVIQTHPEFASRVIDEEMLEQAAEMYDFDPDDPERDGFSEERAVMGGFYVRNNVGIALRSFAGGILLGTLTVYVLLSNGLAIGTIAGYILSKGHGPAFTSFVISHGSFELTALAVAGGAGLMLGDILLHPGQQTRLDALLTRGLDAVRIAFGAGVMLVIAAGIEAFWSPSGVPSSVKYLVGGLLWVLVAAWLSLAGRSRNRN